MLNINETLFGNAPVILVAGHAGLNIPKNMPDNKLGSINPRLADLYTDSLVKSIYELGCKSGNIPDCVLTNIARTKVDVNDSPDLAYSGVGQEIYDDFHTRISSLIKQSKKIHGWVLILDIHGFAVRDSHPALLGDVILGTVNGLTMPTDGINYCNRVQFMHFLRTKGWVVYPNGIEAETIFQGGYIIRRHSKPGELIFGIQIEISSLIRKDEVKRHEFAESINEWIQFLCMTGSQREHRLGNLH